MIFLFYNYRKLRIECKIKILINEDFFFFKKKLVCNLCFLNNYLEGCVLILLRIFFSIFIWNCF